MSPSPIPAARGGSVATVRMPPPSVQAPPPAQETPEGYIAVVCKCGQKLQAREKYAGTRVRCPSCRNFLILPGEPLRESLAPQVRPLPPHERKSALPPAAPANSKVLYWVAAAVGVLVLLGPLAYFGGLVGKGAKGGNAPADAKQEDR